MEMNNFRSESHVAQQSRRDKLRVQHQNSEHLVDHYNNLEQYPDLVQLRNLKYGTAPYDPTVFSSDMSYVTKKNSHVLLPQNDQSLVSADKFSVANLSHPISSNLSISVAKLSGDPHNCSNWKSIGSQQNCDWVVNNYSSNSTSIHENNVNNTLFVGGEGGMPGSLKVNNISSQPTSFGYQDLADSSLVANLSGESSIIHQNSQRNFGGMQHCSASSLFDYQNTLQEVVTSATVGAQGEDISYRGNDSNELLLSSFGDTRSAHVRVCNNSGNWVNRPVEDFWTVRHRRMIADSSNAQGLSLSLSSVPLSNTREGKFGERNYSSDPLDSKALRSDYLCSSSRTSIGSKVFGNTRENIVETTIPLRNAVGPLGPFTGYATILKNSKFLKPTLQLLDEFCGITVPNQIESHVVYSNKNSEEAGVSSDHAVNATESAVEPKHGESGVSSSTFYSSNEISGEAGGLRSSSNGCYRPDYHLKKTKLLYMQEEVCRRYKQYHQQMQMVVSSFESVAGLSAATPFISMALKTVSRHFRCLKHAITDHLRHMGKALREDLSSPTAGATSSTKGDTSTSRFKFVEHSFQKQKSGGSNLVFFEPQQPVWRPQRGLPERAVAVLRAWLFDHFLHPYPTDSDKHMLATQTGLTRNQVSNWFINARVRVWKPMVEEIHILETKGSAEPSSQTGKADGKPASENASRQYDNQPTSKLPGFDPSRDGPSAELWNQDKRSRIECQIPASMDGSLMSFLPYQRGGLEIGAGLGAVSLTLGLRQSAESAQQQQQQQQEHYRQHFGGQMVHDFVG